MKALAASGRIRALLSARCAAATAILAGLGVHGVNPDPATPLSLPVMPAMLFRIGPASRRWQPLCIALLAWDAAPVARGR